MDSADQGSDCRDHNDIMDSADQDRTADTIII